MKRLKICCSILMLCFSMMLFAGCDSKLASIQVIGNTVETNIAYGHTVDLEDFADLQVLATFEDGTSRVVNYADAEADFEIDFSSIISTTPDEYSVEITYQDVTTTITLTVAPAHITGFVIDRSGISETIGFGLTPNWNNLIVKKVYADDSVSNPHKTALTTLEYSIDTSAYIPTTAGEYQIVVAYGAFTTQTFIVEVSSSVVTGIELDLTHVDQTLLYGTALDLENDLVVKAVYDDETTTNLSFGEYEIVYGGFSATTPDDYTITITYNEIFTKYFVVTVAEPHVTGFEVDSSAIPATVTWGTTPTWSGVVVSAVYADNTVSNPHKVVLTSGYSVNTATFNPNVAGTYTITVSYGAFTPFTFTVIVSAPHIVGFEFDRSAIPTTVAWGTTPTWSGVVVSAVYADNTVSNPHKETLTSDYSVNTTAFNSNLEGIYTITISYSPFDNKTFTVEVLPARITSITADRTAIPETVGYGSEIAWEDLIVKAIYEDSTQEIAHEDTLTTEDYTLNKGTFNTTVAGTYTIYVNYLTFSTSFAITVSTTSGTFAYDGDTLVIFQDTSYGIGDTVTNITYTKEGTSTPVAIEGTQLLIDELGNFTLNYTLGGVAKEKSIKVVPWISAFGFGESIALFNNGTTTATTNFISTADKTYKVGTANYFYFDVSMNSAIITNEEYISFNFVASTTIDGTYSAIEDLVLNTNQSEVYGTGFAFNSDYNGYYIRATLTPKYNNRAAIVMEFVLNSGVNVFTDAELKVAYGSLSVQNINIHRTIVCTLSANQTNADGESPLNYYSLDGGLVTTDANGDLIANNTGNVYARYSDSKTGDNLVINGNYQTINGSNLSLINLDYAGGEGVYEQPGSLKDLSKNDNGVVNSQIAIFKSEVRDSSATISENTSLAFNTANNNNITYNNLVVIGNTTVPEASQGSALKTNSGSYAGIRASYNDVTTNNCIIKNTCIGLFMDGEGTDFFANNSKIYESWANLVYSSAGNILSLTNCQLSNAGGSAVWMEDSSVSDDELYNPKFIMDTSTKIENFVAGSEAWFTAYNMTGVPTLIKTVLEIPISADPFNKTALKITTYPDGNGGTIDVEKFNFTVIIANLFAYDDEDNADTNEGTFQIGNILVERIYGTLQQNILNPFLCDTTNPLFLARVQELYIQYKDDGMSDNDAMPLAQQTAYFEFSNHFELIYDLTGYGELHMIAWIYDAA